MTSIYKIPSFGSLGIMRQFVVQNRHYSWFQHILTFRSSSQRNMEKPKQLAFRGMSATHTHHPRPRFITTSVRQVWPHAKYAMNLMLSSYIRSLQSNIAVLFLLLAAVPFREHKKRWAFCKNNMAAFFGTRTGFLCNEIVGAVFVQWQVDVLDLGPTLP